MYSIDRVISPPTITRDSHSEHRGLLSLFGIDTAKVSAFTNSILRFLKKVAATTMVIASCFGGSCKKMLLIGTSVTTIATTIPKTAFASPWKSYSSLSPTEKLATTPLYYVTNSQGSPYLQEDIQVIQLCEILSTSNI